VKHRPTSFLGVALALLVCGGTRASSAPARPQSGTAPAVTWNVTQSPPLKGVNSLQVIIENVDQDAAKCGLTAAGLRTAAEQPVRDGSLRLADPVTDTTSATLDVTVTVVHPNDSLCAGFVDVQLYDVTYFVPSYGQYPQYPLGLFTGQEGKSITVAQGIVGLVHSGGILSGSVTGFSDRSEDAVRKIAGSIVTQIKQANQK
jgi:hypothetical protein